MPWQMVVSTPCAGLGLPSSSVIACRRNETKSREVTYPRPITGDLVARYRSSYTRSFWNPPAKQMSVTLGVPGSPSGQLANDHWLGGTRFPAGISGELGRGESLGRT